MADKYIGPDTIIKEHVIWSMGLGLIPIPGVDFFAVSYIQKDMIKKLAKCYLVDYTDSAGKAAISSIISTGTARVLATSLVKIIPGAGTLVGMSAASLTSGASTYALGEVFKDHFKNGGTFYDINFKTIKKQYSKTFKKGKTKVKQWNDEHTDNNKETVGETIPFEESTPNASTVPESMDQKIERLGKLGEMRDSGVLTEEEFQELKKQLFG